MASHNRGPLKKVALSFLKLGIFAFGGPAAHIAMMEEEFVRRHRWLPREKFLDLLGAASLIPGPTSTEVAIYIGFLHAGWIGLLLAGICFIIPAAIIVTILAWLYVQFGSLPQTISVLYGIKPVVVAVILQALWGLGRSALKTRFLAVICLVSFVVSFLGINPLTILIGAGSVVGICNWICRPRDGKRSSFALALLLMVLPLVFLVQTAAAWTSRIRFPLDLASVFVIFLKIGSVVFGSGYVLLAFLRNDLVVNLHWLNDSQLLDAVIVGQVTPGPVFTTATFIGYLLFGLPGAFVATVGIFLPAFLLVAISGPLVSRIRQSLVAASFLDGVIVGSLALMAYVTYELGRSALIDIITVTWAIVCLLLLIRFRVNSAWLVLAGATIGFLMSLLK
ncbi:MAG TPA: chromate efflux transporter [Candidatus Bathyarchaeia archaeon]|nr:chromate efflux transporter [Candidatus Bathyarchaeia archaeon]